MQDAFISPGFSPTVLSSFVPLFVHFLSAISNVNPAAQEKGLEHQFSQSADTSKPTFVHPLATQSTKEDVLVDFDGPNDPYRPLNGPSSKKVIPTVLYGFTTCWITFASAIYSAAVAAVAAISREFQVGWEVSTLGTSLFVVGFALGPLIFAPLSEIYGRKWTVLIASPLVDSLSYWSEPG